MDTSTIRVGLEGGGLIIPIREVGTSLFWLICAVFE